jgi:hypothetical protein
LVVGNRSLCGGSVLLLLLPLRSGLLLRSLQSRLLLRESLVRSLLLCLLLGAALTIGLLLF